MHTTGNLVADTICRTAELGLTITDAADAGTLTIINADPVDVADTCPDCAMPGVKRDHIRRRLVDLPDTWAFYQERSTRTGTRPGHGVRS
ncbi:hypothetical protein [Timonella senegalensis]|uniref:hypothetical protein n=1 Tax=Timonella senegalensis TaxID=1465825 RepID=UPI0002F18914|nr:hypothetical protein [Timonella senegalensis]